MEGFWQQSHLLTGSKRFQSRNNGYINTGFTTLLNKIKKLPVIKKHLGYNVVGPGFNFHFQVPDVGADTGCFEVFFGVACNSDTKVGGINIFKIFIQKLTFIHGPYLLDQIQRLPFAYHDRTSTGELIQRSTSDVDHIRRFLADQAFLLRRRNVHGLP